MNRVEHLKWCKQRAGEYLDQGDIPQAVASMISDLSKHPETSDISHNIAMLGAFEVMRGTVHSARRFIEGFN